MKAAILKDKGDVSQLEIEDVAKPLIAKDEIIVRTRSISINPIEVKTRKGNRFTDKLLQDHPSILGWDASGIVLEAGQEVQDFKTGDRVFGIIGFPNFGKTYAEHFAAKPEDLRKIPENVGFDEAAASTIAAITAFQALRDYGKLKAGKKVLIHAASGGVGHFGVQLAKHFGAEVYATASEEKRDFVTDLGADHFIDYKTENFEDVVQNMDVVFDLIGGDYIDRSLKTLKSGGTIISIPSATNAEVEEKAQKNGCQGVRFSLTPDAKDMQAIADLLKEGTLKPYISKKFSLDDVRRAHTELEKGHTRGKIVMTCY